MKQGRAMGLAGILTALAMAGSALAQPAPQSAPEAPVAKEAEAAPTTVAPPVMVAPPPVTVAPPAMVAPPPVTIAPPAPPDQEQPAARLCRHRFARRQGAASSG